MTDLKQVTVDGIDLAVSPDLMGSFRVFDATCDLMEAVDAGDDKAAMLASRRWMSAVLGDDKPRVLAELDKAHGGAASVTDVQAFCAAVLEAAGAKN